MKRFVKKILGKALGVNYMKLKDIKIPQRFLRHKPSLSKMIEKEEYFKKYGMLKESIIVDQTDYLIDGYTSYLIAKKAGVEALFVSRYKD